MVPNICIHVSGNLRLAELLKYYKQETTEVLCWKVVSGNISAFGCFPSFLPYLAFGCSEDGKEKGYIRENEILNH
jgi:hypothetical protein